MNARIQFFGIGTSKIFARVTIEQAGHPDRVFEVDDVFISDDSDGVEHLADVIGAALEGDLH